jgi:hypothetical protein
MPYCVTYVPGMPCNLCVGKLCVRSVPARIPGPRAQLSGLALDLDNVWQLADAAQDATQLTDIGYLDVQFHPRHHILAVSDGIHTHDIDPVIRQQTRHVAQQPGPVIGL